MDDDDDDEVSRALSDVKNQWQKAYDAASAHAQAIRSHGISENNAQNAMPLTRLNALAQDSLALLRNLQSQFEILSEQLISIEEKELCFKLVEDWKRQYQNLHSSLRTANLQAKDNTQKAKMKERELLLSGGNESTNLRRNLQTQAGMTAAAESITESLRRTRQMMLQELDRGANTLASLDQSTTTLRKAESEYKGQQTLLMITKGLLSILKRQDIVDRFILVVGFITFTFVAYYIFNQRIGILKMRRNEVAFSVVDSLETTLSVDIPVKVDTVPPSKLDTISSNQVNIGPPKNLPVWEGAQKSEESFDGTICKEDCSSSDSVSQATGSSVCDEL